MLFRPGTLPTHLIVFFSPAAAPHRPGPPCLCSALYFSSLLLLGIGLPAWAKPWKKIKWGKRKATQLPAPAVAPTPAQEVADSAAAANAPAEQPSAPAAPAAAS